MWCYQITIVIAAGTLSNAYQMTLIGSGPGARTESLSVWPGSHIVNQVWMHMAW